MIMCALRTKEEEEGGEVIPIEEAALNNEWVAVVVIFNVGAVSQTGVKLQRKLRFSAKMGQWMDLLGWLSAAPASKNNKLLKRHKRKLTAKKPPKKPNDAVLPNCRPSSKP
jgi:hypothetical protein